MATLNISANGKAMKGRNPKSLPQVDLTAMVDLAFLLITFFMLTTSLTKIKAIDIAKPVAVNPPIFADYPASRTMTILLGKNNKAAYYMGETKNAIMNWIDLKSIKDPILANKLQVKQAHVSLKEQQLIVIIKPGTNSTYKNFVDVIDEMHLADIQSYAIDDKYFSAQEQTFLLSRFR